MSAGEDGGLRPAEVENERGNDAFLAGRFADAAAGYEAAVRALRPEDDDVAPGIYENLGLAYCRLRRLAPATRAFLRALDGAPASREQSLRFLVDCLFQDGRPHDGERHLRLYERAFGPHPSGWSRQAPPAPSAG